MHCCSKDSFPPYRYFILQINSVVFFYWLFSQHIQGEDRLSKETYVSRRPLKLNLGWVRCNYELNCSICPWYQQCSFTALQNMRIQNLSWMPHVERTHKIKATIIIQAKSSRAWGVLGLPHSRMLHWLSFSMLTHYFEKVSTASTISNRNLDVFQSHTLYM